MESLSGNRRWKVHTLGNSQQTVLYDDGLLSLTFLIHKMGMLACCPKNVSSTTRALSLALRLFRILTVSSAKRKEIIITSGDDTGLGRVTNRSDDRIKTYTCLDMLEW